MVLVLFGCSQEQPQQDLSLDATPPADEAAIPDDTSAPDDPLAPPAQYTIIFDRNTTPDDLTDDETYEYTVTSYDENYTPIETTERSIMTVEYSDTAIIPTAVPAPEREGYYFAGWQTRPNVTADDLVYGVSPYLWLFGNQSNFGGGHEMYITDIESLSEDGTATLYARWVEIKDISTEAELRDISNDLYGAYRLTADIELTEPWTPIGCYFSNYEYYSSEWWMYAFHGILDGDGHSISGLTINGLDIQESNFAASGAIWYDEGDRADGTAAFFGACSDATIRDLTLVAPVINVSGEFAAKGDYAYVATLASFDMNSTIENVTVQAPVIAVEISDMQNVLRENIYAAVSGLVAGGWNDYITNCTIEGAHITVDATLQNSHGGEVYAGGIVGESYTNLTDCVITSDIDVTVFDNAGLETDHTLKVNVGGMNASNTNSIGCNITSDLNVTVSKPKGVSEISIGGATGAQRYMAVDSAVINSNIETDLDVDTENSTVGVGAVCGTVDVYYTTQILLYNNEMYAGCKKNTAKTLWNGQNVSNNIGFLPEIDGQPIGWINKGEYAISEENIAPSNIEILAERYGTYMPVEYMMDGIIWIVTE